MRKSQEDVHRFWFDRLNNEGAYPSDKVGMWFSNDPEIDDYIRQEFSDTLIAAEKGLLQTWKSSPSGALSLIIVYSQLPKFVYRGTDKMYQFIDEAARLADWACIRNMDRSLFPIESIFIYFALIESEDIDLAMKAEERFTRLSSSAPASIKLRIDNFRNYAIDRMAILKKFGRFPERNHVFGRESTQEENEYLAERDIAS